MKKISVFALVAILIILGITQFSCKKTSNTNTTTTSGNTSTINQLFDQLKSQPQEILVWAGRDTIVWGADTTMLHFYTNSFKDANNNVITGQQIYVHLTEMYHGGSMIANRTTTISYGGDTLLQSGGEVNIFFSTLNGETVYTNGYGIGYYQRAASTLPMYLYYGNNNYPDSNTYWSLGNVNSAGAVADSTTAVNYSADTSVSQNIQMYLLTVASKLVIVMLIVYGAMIPEVLVQQKHLLNC